MLILNQTDVERVLTMDVALAGVREAYSAVAAGSADVPQRHSLRLESPPGDTLVMSGHLPAQAALGLKVVSVMPDNVARGLPATVGAVLLLDAETGVPAVLMDGTFLTAIRTGAASGVATAALACPQADTVALLGSGGMAWHQLEAVCHVRPVRRVRVWSRTLARAEAFVQKAAARLPEIELSVAATAEAAVRGASIVCAATGSPDPVVHGDWLDDGAHVNLVGSHSPEYREIDTAALQRADVIAVDAVNAALVAGDLAIPVQAGDLDPGRLVPIGDILAGRAAGRTDPGQITVFKSVGLAAQDLAVGRKVYELARAAGLGTFVSLGPDA